VLFATFVVKCLFRFWLRRSRAVAKEVILLDWTDQGRRTIKDPPDRAEAAKAEATKLGIQVKNIFYIRRTA
jgi:uncharacterized protein with GYD domain